MSKIPFAAVVITLLIGCQTKPEQKAEAQPSQAEAKPSRERSVTDVAAALHDKRVTVVDANGSETREKYGVVPGALLLSDHRSYNLSELPSNKAESLVFYCGGTQCRASDTAAARAASAGYADVSVMRDGIRGWVSAGQTTSSVPKS